MTIFEDRLKEAGFDMAMLELKHALANLAKMFVKSGGTKEQFLAACNAVAEQMLSGDQASDVQQDQFKHVPAQPPKPGEGQSGSVQQDQVMFADAQLRMPEGQVRGVHQDQKKTADGLPIVEGGQGLVVQQDHYQHASFRGPIASGNDQTKYVREDQSPAVPPAREPSTADIEALKESGDFAYFQMIKLRSRAWTTYRYSHLKNVRSLNIKENMVINDVIDWGRMHRIREDDLVHLTMPANEMKKIVRRAQTAVHAKAEMLLKPLKKSAKRGR